MNATALRARQRRRLDGRAGRDRASADAGVSLVEVVMAVLMLGAAVVTIVGAFGTLVISSDRSAAHSDVATTLAAAAEAIGDPVRNPYPTDCASPPPYDPAAGVTVPPSIGVDHVTVTQILYWNGAAFGPDCHDDNPLFRLQQVTIRVSSINRRVEQTLTVLKRG